MKYDRYKRALQRKREFHRRNGNQNVMLRISKEEQKLRDIFSVLPDEVIQSIIKNYNGKTKTRAVA